jgi:alpha-L-fucosidase
VGRPSAESVFDGHFKIVSEMSGVSGGVMSRLATCIVVSNLILLLQTPILSAIPSDLTPTVIVDTQSEPMAAGKFEPTWESLQQYQVPEWFRDAKFGVWAHWGPQCQPEQGDWYARGMYQKDSTQYRSHMERYGDPAKFGFKDVINSWKAEKFSPDELVALYKRAGAQYFFAMANHHDNMDLWDSKYQPWNSVATGPKKDLIDGWAKAARANGLKFGVSMHAAHAWTWYEPAQDFDGKLTRADGAGQWWEGLDPMNDLYCQSHPRSRASDRSNTIHSQWNWGSGASTPDQPYCDKFYNRAVNLINKHQPDLLYFDDTALPLWPVSDAGLKIAAHYYNSNMQRNGGKLEAVLFGKVLDEQQRKCMVWDIERGQSAGIEPLPYQTDTCIGSWHYDRGVYDRNRYKSAATVIRMLVDIVSKNGCLLLNVPVRGDGTIDEKERAIVEGITAWMDVNRESIVGTRPWKVCGEGPQLAAAAPITAQGFNEGRGKPFTAEDIRYTVKGKTLYATVMGNPTREVTLKSLGTGAKLLDGSVGSIEMLGSDEKLKWARSEQSVIIEAPRQKLSEIAVVFKITLE